MFRNLIFLLLSLFILSASTCEEEVDLSINTSSPKLVINSTFSPNHVFEVLVSKTQGIFEENAYQDIEDATVQIYHGDKLIERLSLINAVSPSYYIGNSFPEAGKNYTIKINTPSLPAIEASNKIPKKVAIASVNVTGVQEKNLAIIGPGGENKEYLFTVKTTINDPEDGRNYYHLNFYIEAIEYHITGTDTTKIVLPAFGPLGLKDPIDSSPAVPFLLEGALIKDQSFNGQRQSFSFNLTYQLDASKELIGNVIVELRSISKEYYLYHSSLHRHIQAQKSSFSEPVIVFNNIENGYGIFSGYNLVRSASIPIKE